MEKEELKSRKERMKKLNKSFNMSVFNTHAIIGLVCFLICGFIGHHTKVIELNWVGFAAVCMFFLLGIGKTLAGIWQTLDEIKDKMNKENPEA